jgi:hypothetical protein
MNFFRMYAAVTESETAKAKAAAALLQDENKIPEVEKPKAKKTKAAKPAPAEPAPDPAEEETTDLPDESGEDGEE